MYFYESCAIHYLILQLDQNASVAVAPGAPFCMKPLRLLHWIWGGHDSVDWTCPPDWIEMGQVLQRLKFLHLYRRWCWEPPFNDQFRGPPNGQPGWKSHVQSLPNKKCLGERPHRQMLSCRQAPPKLSELCHCLNSDRSMMADWNEKMFVRGFLVCWAKTRKTRRAVERRSLKQ